MAELNFVPAKPVLMCGKGSDGAIYPMQVDTDGKIVTNSEYFKGYFATESALTTAYPNTIVDPTVRNGWYAILGSTDTVWIWDADTNAWIDSSVSATGDVVGPASATANNLAAFDGITGKLIKDGGVSSSTFAPAAKGVTNGDTHDHNGGDGAAIVEAAITLADNTTNNASTTKHGFSPKATAPAAGIVSVLGIANGETVRTDKEIFDSTNPAALGTAAPGTATVAARRDHVHALPAADGTVTVTSTSTSSTSYTWNVNSKYFATLNLFLQHNVTVTISNPVDGGRYRIRATEDETGTRTLTVTNGATEGAGGSTVKMNTTGDVINLIELDYHHATTTYDITVANYLRVNV